MRKTLLLFLTTSIWTITPFTRCLCRGGVTAFRVLDCPFWVDHGSEWDFKVNGNTPVLKEEHPIGESSIDQTRSGCAAVTWCGWVVYRRMAVSRAVDLSTQLGSVQRWQRRISPRIAHGETLQN